MRKIKLRALMILTAVIVAVAGGTSALAEGDKSTLIVSPMNQDVILQPGESYSGSIKVSNPNDAAGSLKYSVSVGSFNQVATEGAVDDYSQVDTETQTAYNQMMDWITLGTEGGEVAPNETDIVTFTIDVPETAPGGGQYATILVQNEEDDDTGEGNISIKSKVQLASIIYAEVAGETVKKGAILENDLPGFLLDNTLEATSVVQNDGNIHTDATYALQVWPLFSNEEICTNEEKPDEALVMPGTKKYNTQSCELPAIGIFNAKQTVTIFGETSVVEKTILVCPVWLLFIIFFVIAAIIIWIVMRARGRSKAAKRSSAAKAE